MATCRWYASEHPPQQLLVSGQWQGTEGGNRRRLKANGRTVNGNGRRLMSNGGQAEGYRRRLKAHD